MRKHLLIALAVAAMLAISSVGFAEALVIGGGWYNGTGDVAHGGWVYDPMSWTLDSATPVIISITDAWANGDYYELYDNGTLIVTTPPVPVNTVSGIDPDAAFVRADFSHVSVLVGAGSHEFTVRDLLDFTQYPSMTPFGMAIRADRCVPEPSSVLSLLAGFTGIGGMIWRRRR